MTDHLRNALDAYRERTRRAAGPDFAERTLDRIGLADRYLAADSALGPVFVAWNPRGVSAVRRFDDAEAFERWFRGRFGRRAFPAATEPEIVNLVRRALAGEAVAVPLDLRDCTPFAAAVLRKTQEIPFGHARSYAWVAREIEHPRATRAVGSALADNPIPLLIPCHRVVHSDYSTGAYVFGSAQKRRLLEAEGLEVDAIHQLARTGVRYIGLPEDGCFCLPTCGANVMAAEYPRFHTAEEALAAGLEPCSVCRPIAA